MPEYAMLSDASCEQGDRLLPNPYQFAWLNALLGGSGPGCEHDKDETFDGQLWYAFTRIIEGDISSIREVDLDPSSWYSPEEILAVDATILVDDYLERERPEWWAKMVALRGDPVKSIWGLYFQSPREEDEIEPDDHYPEIYELTEAQKTALDSEAREYLVERLRREVTAAQAAEIDDEGLIWGLIEHPHTRKWEKRELFFRAEDELESELYGQYQLTDSSLRNSPLYVERLESGILFPIKKNN